MRGSVEVLTEELNALYFPYVSPNAPRQEGQNPNRGSSPIERTLPKIEKKRAELEKKRMDYITRIIEAEEWLETVDDIELQGIIRAHFFLNKTWRETAKIIYGYANKETPRLRVERFFKCTQNYASTMVK